MENMLKIKDKNNDITTVEYRELNLSYMDKIMELQNIIIEGLENKELYAPTEKEEFIKVFDNGKIIGYLNDKEELIAMAVYVKKGYDSGNYGYDLGIKNEDLLNVAQVESTVVIDKYRGNRLQRILCEKIEQIAKKDRIAILAATASPYNKYSVNTFKALGYEIKKDKIKYGGLRRYILAKTL